ncbi:hypothetical protein HMPREF7215_1819 [Pyramidobacter piscolens W5455]|uniref:Uncharacterized protein n=1 Tax=Pyramidobacter piscolens W5455 TaxID=352165 RepID=A0ABM9ZT63_9BACT|nr:hypothetical protein HMPREF7215_1819 [Pyramidobacter piscolens W5455]
MRCEVFNLNGEILVFLRELVNKYYAMYFFMKKRADCSKTEL